MLPGKYLAVFIWRTVIVWSGLHIATVALGGSLLYPFRAFLLALAVTVMVLLADAERRNERRFLANLGVSRAGIGAVVASSAFTMEGVLRLIAGGLVR